MKPSRKLNRGSFVTLVSGGHAAGGSALTELIGKGKPGAPINDHDLGGPPVKGSGGAGAVDYDA